MAMESKDNAQIIQCSKRHCKVECTFDKIDIANMPMFDMLNISFYK